MTGSSPSTGRLRIVSSAQGRAGSRILRCCRERAAFWTTFPFRGTAFGFRSQPSCARDDQIDRRRPRRARCPESWRYSTERRCATSLQCRACRWDFRPTTLPTNITPWVLSDREVCFVGEALAMIVADSRYVAEDAAALVAVDYEPLDVVADCREAMKSGAPLASTATKTNVVENFKLAYGDVAAEFARSHARIPRESVHPSRRCAPDRRARRPGKDRRRKRRTHGVVVDANVARAASYAWEHARDGREQRFASSLRTSGAASERNSSCTRRKLPWPPQRGACDGR